MEYHLHKPVKEPLFFGNNKDWSWCNEEIMTWQQCCFVWTTIQYRLDIAGKSLLNRNHWVDERETEQEAMAFAIACSRNSWTLMFSGWFRRSFYCFLNAPWTSNETITTMNLSGCMEIISLQTNGIQSPRVKAPNIFRKSYLLSSKAT
jgi:hypothetical protein